MLKKVKRKPFCNSKMSLEMAFSIGMFQSVRFSKWLLTFDTPSCYVLLGFQPVCHVIADNHKFSFYWMKIAQIGNYSQLKATCCLSYKFIGLALITVCLFPLQKDLLQQLSD